MQCDEIQEQLSAYLEDTLSPAERGIIDDHLRSCPECRKSLADLEMTISSIKGLDEIIPPPWLTQKVMTRVKAEAERKNRSLLQKLFYPLYIKLPIEAAGIFLVAITALYVFKSIEPELKTVIAPSEETLSEYAPKGKARKPSPKVERQSQSPGIPLSKKDKPPTESHSLPESGQRPAPMSEQFMYDKGASVKEKRTKVQEVPEKKMPQKSAPAPAEMSAPDGLKLEGAPRAAGKTASVLSEKEDISLSFKVNDIDSAKKELEEVLTDVGGKVVREEPASDALVIIGELGSDKLLPFIQKLKALGYLNERTPTPMSDKDRVLVKITILGN
jgi:hypothetical protein